MLGNAVRYDGKHKRQPWLVEELGRFADFIPYCPEMAIGLGVPRDPIELHGDPAQPRARGVVAPSLDVTDALHACGDEVSAGLVDVAGYIFKGKSPSCGVARVKVRLDNGKIVRKGRGVYAAAILSCCPNLPIEEEGRLNDPVLRKNFVTRLYVWQRWLALLQQGINAERLLDFHARHKCLVMLHSQAACHRMGNLLSQFNDADPENIAPAYANELMIALQRRAGKVHHVNVLRYIISRLKNRLATSDAQELLDSIESYRRGDVPLIESPGLLRHQFNQYPDEYIDMQWYLWPYPDDLDLRSYQGEPELADMLIRGTP